MSENNKNSKQTEKDELTGDFLIGGHEYDGIQELANSLPPWWKYLFYITIIFSLVYVVLYFVDSERGEDWQENEYKAELKEASEKYGKVTKNEAEFQVLLSDSKSLEEGKKIYDKNCIACHLAEGQGIVGPNLTDEFWIHGCDFKSIYDVIKNGVIDKGMTPWKGQLTPKQMQQVGSYIVSLKGTNPPNPKEPQGEKCSL